MFLHGQRGAGVLSRLCACFSSRLPLPCRLLPSPSRLSPSPLECGFSSEAGDRDAPAKPAWESEGKVKYANFLLESFDGTFGRGLLPDSLEGLSELEKARKLYEAPFVCAAHEFTERGVKAGQGPVMVYGNLKAQRAFGLSWDDFLGFPSSKTADPSQQTERNALIQKCSENGWVSVAGIVRVRSDGSFFRVKDGVLWTLLERVGGKEGEGETGCGIFCLGFFGLLHDQRGTG
uniref:MEKHLA domain-containing protein n=1 Tax=Chromera velia CCMP2878 TaxID=1169474 RepID=A0A0G4F484_9ALVE|eukprot:Cvel_2712.t1-p1 / transcript=Cvel_2712.t1 / gene=Cvel_2712 / organism=Chromera_velia_CCMP2878 / gene_product=hypothetical protein / transcript_product=hypothetical protein / location=Cvel_scaffold109:13305-16357(+) / protein_length=232 / sequence_SO=supercontig / SO=protein_coding / is_pseudo=false